MADDNNGHEDRLQTAEARITDFAGKVAENAVQFEYLSKRVEDGFTTLRTSVEDGFLAVHQQIDDGQQRMESMAERIGEHGRKLDRLEDEKKRNSERWDGLKKLVVPAVTGAGAIGIKELVVLLIHHFGH